MVVERMFRMPNDTTLVKFISKIGNHLGAHLASLLPPIIAKLESQPK